MEDPETSLSQDNPTSPDSRETPPTLKNYSASLNNPDSPFKNTKSLRTLADKCLKEGIEPATQWFVNDLEKEKIQLCNINTRSQDTEAETAILPGGQKVIYVQPNFLTDLPPLDQLIELTHKYKSLRLRELKLRHIRKETEKILITDIDFLHFLRTLPEINREKIDQYILSYYRKLNQSRDQRNAPPLLKPSWIQ